MKISTTSERLKWLLEERKMRQVDLLEAAKPYTEKYKVKLNKNDLSQYINGKTEPGQNKLAILGLALNVNEAWLMGYDVPMERITTYNYTNCKGIEPLPAMKKIPLLGAVACGEPIYREEDEWVDVPEHIKADFCLRCEGESMIDARINDGDIVFIKACPQVENGQIAAVSVDNEVTLKRVYYYPEKSKLVLYPENKAYEPFVYTNEELNDIRILGRAVWFLSKVK